MYNLNWPITFIFSINDAFLHFSSREVFFFCLTTQIMNNELLIDDNDVTAFISSLYQGIV